MPSSRDRAGGDDQSGAGTRYGFSVTELLVSIGVLGVLFAILIPAVQAARESARTTHCINNLKQIGVALHAYEATYAVYPPSFIRQEDGNPPPPRNTDYENGWLIYRGHWTGFHMLLPFLGTSETELYQQFDFDQTWLSHLRDSGDQSVRALNQTLLPVLICPSVNRNELKIGTSINSGIPIRITQRPGTAEAEIHWMGGAPSDYAFCHGSDNIFPFDSIEARRCGPIVQYWSQQPAERRGPFGLNSNCAAQNFVDGAAHTMLLGEKSGSLLTYMRSEHPVGRLKVEYPWAMAASTFYAATGYEGAPQSAWVVAPLAVTRDIRLPECHDDPPGAGIPYPMNPVPRHLPVNADERPLFSFQSPHNGYAHFLMGDGSTRRLNETINQSIWEAISTLADGVAVTEDDY